MPKKTKLKNSNKMDMINGPIWNKLPRFALPVAATAILEQLFNASDIAVVGNFTGAAKTASVAAVGANSPVIGLILNLFIGIALGTNVIIANAIGRDDRETVQRAVHTSVLTSIIGGFLVMIPGEIFAVQILSMTFSHLGLNRHPCMKSEILGGCPSIVFNLFFSSLCLLNIPIIILSFKIV